jgi:hypothetical protein
MTELATLRDTAAVPVHDDDDEREEDANCDFSGGETINNYSKAAKGAATRERSRGETLKQMMEDASRWSARCVAHLAECECLRSECETVMEECAVMIERERGALDNLRAKTSLDESVRKMTGVHEIRHHLVDSLVRAGTMNRLSCVTTALAVSYLDYFLVASGYSARTDQKWIYQLVSTACMFVACKFEESTDNARRNVSTMLQMASDISFDNLTIRKMEAILLRELNWDLCRVTPFMYIPHFLCLIDCEATLRSSRQRTVEVLRRAEIWSLQVLYDIRVMCAFESSVIAKAIIAVVLADYCDDLSGADLAKPLVSHLLKHIKYKINWSSQMEESSGDIVDGEGVSDANVREMGTNHDVSMVTARVVDCIEQLNQWKLMMHRVKSNMEAREEHAKPNESPVSQQY